MTLVTYGLGTTGLPVWGWGGALFNINLNDDDIDGIDLTLPTKGCDRECIFSENLTECYKGIDRTESEGGTEC